MVKGQFYNILDKDLIELRGKLLTKSSFLEEYMEGFEVKQIKNLICVDISHLVKESKEEGFRFLERLVNDFKNETNNFNKQGEFLRDYRRNGLGRILLKKIICDAKNFYKVLVL